MIGRLLPPLSDTARALLAKERLQQPTGDEALRQRLLDRALLAVGADRPSGVGLQAAAPPARVSARSRAPRTLLLIAAAVAVAGLAAAGAGIYQLKAVWAPSSPPWVAPIDTVAPLPPPTGAAGVTPRQVQAEQAAGPTVVEPRRAAAAVDSAPAASVQSYARELGLLEPARSSIAQGNFGSALTAIAQHQREFPRGQLAQEREALRIRALWGLGETDAAEKAAAGFRTRYPHSGLLNWMKQPAK